MISALMPDSAYRIVYSVAEEAARLTDTSSTGVRQTEFAHASSDLFAAFGNTAVELEWRAKNARRVELIHKRIARTLERKESQELNGLQQLADRRQQEKAPRDTALLEDIEKALGIDDDSNDGD